MTTITELLVWVLCFAPINLELPPVQLDDALRFPSYKQCCEYRDRAWDHRQEVWKTLQSWEAFPEEKERIAYYKAWYDEAVTLHSLWVDVCWAVGDPDDNPDILRWARIAALERIRDKIGVQAYTEGRLPPSVVTWRIRLYE